jgi:hypothetical protein
VAAAAAAAAAAQVIFFTSRWGEQWFRYWPAPPAHVLDAVAEEALPSQPGGAALAAHLAGAGCGAADALWRLVRTALSQVRAGTCGRLGAWARARSWKGL